MTNLDSKLRASASRLPRVLCDIGAHAGEWKLSAGNVAIYLTQDELDELDTQS